MALKVLLAAEEAAGLQVLRALVRRGDAVAAVLTSGPRDRRGGAVAGDFARTAGIRVEPAKRASDPSLAEWVRAQDVDLLLNVHSLHMIAAEVVAATRIGSFNLHPGPLPRYAGLNTPSWAIVNGESRHAVTLHWMDAGVDTGPIAYEEWFDLSEDDTGLTVSGRCVRLGVPLVERLLETASADPDAIPRRRQDLSLRRVYRRRDVPWKGTLGWDLPARRIVALVRGADFHPLPSPWGHPEATIGGRTVGLVKARLANRSGPARPGTVLLATDGAAEVRAADEWVRVELVHANGACGPPARILGALP
jgi:methionyl-tRNA formyltransferase